MAISNGTGGYQLGDGTSNEALFVVQGAPTATGWTLVGTMAVTEGTSGHFRARKTGDSAWTCYRIS